MEAVQNAVQNAIDQLNRPAVSSNAHPEDGYRFRARTADELKQSAHLVPGVNPAELPPEDDDPTRIQVHQQLPPLPATPRTTPPKAPSSEWLV